MTEDPRRIQFAGLGGEVTGRLRDDIRQLLDAITSGNELLPKPPDWSFRTDPEGVRAHNEGEPLSGP
jgi:hypothetical protein